MVKCLICGCTDDMACVTDEGSCHWIIEDGTDGVCSACEDKALEIIKKQKKEG